MIMNERVVIRPSSHFLSFVASFFSRTARRSDNAVPCLRIICLALPLAMHGPQEFIDFLIGFQCIGQIGLHSVPALIQPVSRTRTRQQGSMYEFVRFVILISYVSGSWALFLPANLGCVFLISKCSAPALQIPENTYICILRMDN